MSDLHPLSKEKCEQDSGPEKTIWHQMSIVPLSPGFRAVKGDILQLTAHGENKLLIHGCNCFRTMSAGLAPQIKERYPAVYEADLRTEHGGYGKLGTISTAVVKNSEGHHLIIVNAYIQYHYGRRHQTAPHLPTDLQYPATDSNRPGHADLEAIRRCFRLVAERFPDKEIYYPQIGAGLAGGPWSTIHEIIDRELAERRRVLVIYQRSKSGARSAGSKKKTP